MREKIGVTFQVPQATGAQPVYEAQGGLDVFETDSPYLLSGGKTLMKPMSIVRSDGPIWFDADGNAWDAMPVSGLLWNPSELFSSGQSGFYGDISAPGRVWQEQTGVALAESFDLPVGLVLSSAHGGELGPELREQFTVQNLGSPPVVAEYNPTTGVGNVSRGTSSADVSGARIDGLVLNKTYVVDLECTGPSNVVLRASTLSGQQYGSSVMAGTRRPVYVTATNAILAISPVANNQSASYVRRSGSIRRRRLLAPAPPRPAGLAAGGAISWCRPRI